MQNLDQDMAIVGMDWPGMPTDRGLADPLKECGKHLNACNLFRVSACGFSCNFCKRKHACQATAFTLGPDHAAKKYFIGHSFTAIKACRSKISHHSLRFRAEMRSLSGLHGPTRVSYLLFTS